MHSNVPDLLWQLFLCEREAGEQFLADNEYKILVKFCDNTLREISFNLRSNNDTKTENFTFWIGNIFPVRIDTHFTSLPSGK